MVAEREGVPETVRDPRLDVEVRRRIRSRNAKLVFAIVSAIVLLSGTSLWVYFGLFHYEPTAHKRVPAGTVFALRAETIELAKFPPLRDKLLSRGAGGPKGAGQKGFLDVLQDETGIRLATDVRELVVATTDGTSLVVLMGGRLKNRDLIPGIQRTLQKLGVAGASLHGGLLVFEHGAAIAQADDGTLVIGTNTDVTNAALSGSDDWEKLSVPTKGAVNFAVAEGAWKAASRVLGSLEGATHLGSIRTSTGALSLGDAPELALRFVVAPGTAPTVAGALEQLCAGLQLARIAAPDLAGEKDLFSRVHPIAKGDSVTIELKWPSEGLARGVNQLEELLHQRFQLRP